MPLYLDPAIVNISMDPKDLTSYLNLKCLSTNDMPLITYDSKALIQHKVIKLGNKKLKLPSSG